MNTITPLVGMIPFTFFGGRNKTAGSTFLRVKGLVENSPHFQIWQHGRNYDALIFQKVYWIEMMEIYRGPKILDLCDLDWVNGNVDIIEAGRLTDAITCSSPELTRLLAGYFPKKIVKHVPDRLNLEKFPPARAEHHGPAKKAVWFGYIQNAYQTLNQLAPTLASLDLELTIVADHPYEQEDLVSSLNPKFIKFEQETAYQHISAADIALNPRSNVGGYKFKSNNKSLIAWKLGVPVACTSLEIEQFMNEEVRNHEVYSKQAMVETEYGIRLSAKQYLDIIESI